MNGMKKLCECIGFTLFKLRNFKAGMLIIISIPALEKAIQKFVMNMRSLSETDEI